MQLTRSHIIGAAIELIEADGVEAISMLRLATDLGCGLMALYSLIPSRSALLDGVADGVISGIKITQVPGEGWEEQVRAQASAFREIGRAHPRCTMLAVSRRPAPACLARPGQSTLATLREAGFGDQEAVRIVRALAAYIIGSLADEIGLAPERPDGAESTGTGPRLRAAESAQVIKPEADPRTRDQDADFEFGLDLLVYAAAGRLNAGPGIPAGQQTNPVIRDRAPAPRRPVAAPA